VLSAGGRTLFSCLFLNICAEVTLPKLSRCPKKSIMKQIPTGQGQCNLHAEQISKSSVARQMGYARLNLGSFLAESTNFRFCSHRVLLGKFIHSSPLRSRDILEQSLLVTPHALPVCAPGSPPEETRSTSHDLYVILVPRKVGEVIKSSSCLLRWLDPTQLYCRQL
jgi:hypothetical protein